MKQTTVLLPAVGCLLLGFSVGALTRSAPQDQTAEHGHGHGAEVGGDTGETTGDAPQAGGLDSADSTAWTIAVGNEVCPVMGGMADIEVAIEWRGLRVLFCCPVCEEGFLEDPEGMLEELGFDHERAIAALERLESAEAGQRALLAEELSSTYGLVPPTGWTPELGPDREVPR